MEIQNNGNNFCPSEFVQKNSLGTWAPIWAQMPKIVNLVVVITNSVNEWVN